MPHGMGIFTYISPCFRAKLLSSSIIGPLTRELSSTKSPPSSLGKPQHHWTRKSKTLTPKLSRNSHRTPPCGTLLRCFRALLMPLRMKLNPKVGVFLFSLQIMVVFGGMFFGQTQKNTFQQILRGLNWNSWNTIVQLLYQCFAKCLLKWIDHFCKTISEVPIEAQMVTTYGHTARAPLDSGPNSGRKHGFYGFGRWHLSFECENRHCWCGVNVRRWICFFNRSLKYISTICRWLDDGFCGGRWEFWMPNWRDQKWS